MYAEMRNNFAFDFRNVRVHTDRTASKMAQILGAAAFTTGSDIFFQAAAYDPTSSRGKRLLAHELAHVVQQSPDSSGVYRGPQIQRTSVAEVLWEFFSPLSDERLWVMDRSDAYTKMVGRWGPVRQAIDKAKADLERDPFSWRSDHYTDPWWTPSETYPQRFHSPKAFAVPVRNPPGTDPKTCESSLFAFIESKMKGQPIPARSSELHTCSIGSFTIYVTADYIDVVKGKAFLDIWMFNVMSEESFGKYARHPAFNLSGMKNQHMWWNWTETHSWAPTMFPASASTPPGSEHRIPP